MTRLKAGDKVLTLFNQAHLAGPIDFAIVGTGLGGALDGTLRQYGAFEEQSLVHMPSTLDFQEGSTLPCAALTAWNGLYGLESKALKPGETVLTQGTGGVSISALQVSETHRPNDIALIGASNATVVSKPCGLYSSLKLPAPASLPRQAVLQRGRFSRNSVPTTSSITKMIPIGAKRQKNSRRMV